MPAMRRDVSASVGTRWPKGLLGCGDYAGDARLSDGPRRRVSGSRFTLHAGEVIDDGLAKALRKPQRASLHSFVEPGSRPHRQELPRLLQKVVEVLPRLPDGSHGDFHGA